MAKSVYYYWREASSKADPYRDTKDHITQIFNGNRPLEPKQSEVEFSQ